MRFQYNVKRSKGQVTVCNKAHSCGKSESLDERKKECKRQNGYRPQLTRRHAGYKTKQYSASDQILYKAMTMI
jgi:hypothetical protein